MGWQLRKKQWYFYRTIRIGDRFVNAYFGGGARGAAAELFFRHHRMEQEEIRQILAELKAGRIGPVGRP